MLSNSDSHKQRALILTISHLTVNNNNAQIGRTFCFSFNPPELFKNADNVSYSRAIKLGFIITIEILSSLNHESPTKTELFSNLYIRKAYRYSQFV